MKTQQHYLISGNNSLKWINPWDLDSDRGWVNIAGELETNVTKDMETLYQRVPWLFRGVDLRGGAVKAMPFALVTKAGDDYDTSDDWQNKVGFMPKPKSLFHKIEACLTLTGYAYLFRDKVGKYDKNLRYILPGSARPVIHSDRGLIAIERLKDKAWTPMDVENFVYFWSDDPYTEIGHPSNSPAIAALNAAGVLFNVDEFAARFFGSGAIKATILTVPRETSEPERSRLLKWWQKVTGGGKNAWGTVVASDELNPTTIGEGLESLANSDLTQEKREDIATALGVPHSLLFSDAANYATAEVDVKRLYDGKINEECDFIAEVMNEQVFKRMGLRLEFRPEMLSFNQADEEKRARSLLELMQAISAAEDMNQIDFGLSILGFDYSEDDYKKLMDHFAAKEERRANMAQLALAAPAPAQPEVEETNQPPQFQKQDEQKAVDLDKWKRKALKSLERGKGAAVEFESDTIPLSLVGAIGGALEACKSAEDIERVFSNAWIGYP